MGIRPIEHRFFEGFCEDILQAQKGRTEQSMRGAEMADTLTSVSHFLPLSTVAIVVLQFGMRYQS